jgi:uncharacterized membrane protein YkoI
MPRKKATSKSTPEKKVAKKERITPREATIAATRYYQAITESASVGSVEEIELSEDERYWLVTLGHEDGVFYTQKKYRVFKVNASTGEVLSMKIRDS